MFRRRRVVGALKIIYLGIYEKQLLNQIKTGMTSNEMEGFTNTFFFKKLKLQSAALHVYDNRKTINQNIS